MNKRRLKIQCCMSCINYDLNGCKDPNCECHKPEPKIRICNMCGKPEKPHSYRHPFSPQPEPKEAWRERFDKIFIMDRKASGCTGDANVILTFRSSATKEDIKSFIAETIASEHQKLREIVEKWMQTSNPAYAQDLFDMLADLDRLK